MSASPALKDLEMVPSDDNGLIDPNLLIPNLLEIEPADMVPRLYMNVTIERSLPEGRDSFSPKDLITSFCPTHLFFISY